MLESLFPSLCLKGKSFLPIVQGGMGLGVSAHHLAGGVGRIGDVDTISGVDLRQHYSDLMEETGKSHDGIATRGRFCIDTRLAFALEDGNERELFFRESEPRPFRCAIRPVREFMHYLLTGERPAEVEASANTKYFSFA